jgi:neutral trehalase
MLGLIESGWEDLARDVLENFASLIDRYGDIPNGNRTYYLSRSQPPFFAAMVRLVAEARMIRPQPTPPFSPASRRNTHSGWTAPTHSNPATPIDAWSGCRMERC